MSSDDIDNIFEKAISGKGLVKNRRALTIDYVPAKLPFREKEAQNVAHILSSILKDSKPSNLLLFGKPGTGKTAVVKNVVEKLTTKTRERKMEITVPMINAKRAGSEYKILFEMAEEIGVNKEDKKHQVPFTGLSMGEAIDRILEFIRKKKQHVILVIDEIDSLADKNSDAILYSFTRANERMTEGSFISLIGISNSLTFKDKLDPRVRSSLNEEELVFNPYTVDQLRQILVERVDIAFNAGAISEGAINLCSAMAGREHGDARKAISLLRVAAEIAERERSSKVEEKHVRSAEEKIEKDISYEILDNATTHTKFVVLAVARSKNGNTGEVYLIYSRLCKETHHEPLTQRRVTQIISELDQLGLVSTELVNQGRYGRSQRIKISIPMSTVKDALKNDPTFSTLIEN